MKKTTGTKLADNKHEKKLFGGCGKFIAAH
jgi:hypothetical protein